MNGPAVSKTFRQVIYRLLGLLILMVFWDCNARLEAYRFFAPTLPSSFFPTLPEILKSLCGSLGAVEYRTAFLLTMWRTLVGFVLAGLLAISCALLSARSRLVENLLHYPTELLRQLPAVAIIPFAIILFGIYSPMKIAVAMFGCFFPVFVATLEGLRSVNSSLMLTAKTYQWTGARLLFGVMLPSATSHVLGALRIALAISLILMVMSEMLIGGDGLGMRIVEKERTFDFSGLYAETLLLALLGLCLNVGLDVLGRRIYYWRSTMEWSNSK